MFSLPAPKSKKVTGIIHLSDIHVRTGDLAKSRYEEYDYVFSQLYQSLQELECIKNQSAVIVVLGDLFHEKNRIESAGLLTFNKFVKHLSEIAPVYLIAGNHDLRSDQPDVPDLITSAIYGLSNPNVCYLDQTGCYEVGDLGFSLVDIKSTLKAGATSGHVDQLPVFPNDFSSAVKTKVALFHGTILQYTSLDNFTEAKEGVPLEWIDKDVDLILLGDIHLRQLHGVKQIADSNFGVGGTDGHDTHFQYIKGCWAYSGSLIQQRFSENLFGHGYLVWNLESQTVMTKHIRNKYGMLYVKHTKPSTESTDSFKRWCGSVCNRWVDLVTILDNVYCPSNLIINIKGKSDHSQILELNKLLDIRHVSAKILKHLINSEDSTIVPEKITVSNVDELDDCSSLEVLFEFVETNLNVAPDSPATLHLFDWKQWLQNPECLVVPVEMLVGSEGDKLRTNIVARNTKLYNLVKNYHSEVNNRTSKMSKHVFTMVSINWAWLLPYAEPNWFDFTAAKSMICTINAPNDHGKTSFFEIVFMAIYNKRIPSRFIDKKSASVICNQKPAQNQAYTDLVFKIGETQYRLRRVFVNKLEGGGVQNKETTLDEMVSNEERNTAGSGSTPETQYVTKLSGSNAVDAWVKENIGPSEDFLLSCMITQNCDEDFFAKENTVKDRNGQLPHTKLIDRALHLDSNIVLSGVLKETELLYSYYHDELQNMYESDIKKIERIDAAELEFMQRRYRESMDEESSLGSQLVAIKESVWYGYDTVELERPEQEIIDEIARLEDADTRGGDGGEPQLPIDVLIEKKGSLVAKLENLRPWYCPETTLFDKKLLQELECNPVIDSGCTQTWFDSEEREIKKWRESQAPVVGANSEISIQDRLLAAQTQLNEAREHLQRIVEKTVTRPECEREDYDSWQEIAVERMESLNALLSELGFSEIVQLTDWCFSNSDPRKPDISEDALMAMAANLQREQTQLSVNAQIWLCDHNFSQTFASICDEHQKLTERHRFAEKTQIEENKTCRDLRERWKELETKIKDLKRQAKMLVLPPVSHQHLEKQMSELRQLEASCIESQNFIAQYSDKLDIYDSIGKRYESLEQQAESLDNEIQTVDTGLAFNSECWACLKQPWKVKLNQLQQTRISVQKELDALDVQLNSLETEFNAGPGCARVRALSVEHRQLEEKRIRLLAQLPENKKSLEVWRQYHEIQRVLDDLEMDAETFKAEWEHSDSKVRDQTQVLTFLTRQLHDHEVIVNEAKQFQKDLPRWKQTETSVKQFQQMWSDYQHGHQRFQLMEMYSEMGRETDEWTQRLDGLEKYNRWLSERMEADAAVKKLHDEIVKLENIKRYHQECEQWTPRIVNYERLKLRHQQYTEYLFALNSQIAAKTANDLAAVESRIFRVRDHEFRTEKLKHLRGLLQAQQSWSLKRKLSAQLSQLNSTNKNAFASLKTFENRYDQFTRKAAELDARSKLMATLHQKRLAVAELRELFSGFRHWLYVTKIVPSLTTECNKLVKSLTLDDTYSLEIVVSPDNAFAFYNNNGYGSHEILSSGGFRKFAFGLTLRIALSYLGANSVKCRQLFLDEGFVHADEENLTKVPDFIHSLLGLYDSVILVSHLNVLKESGHVNANISHTNKLSLLQFGQINDTRHDPSRVSALDPPKRREKLTRPTTAESNPHLEAPTGLDLTKCQAITASTKRQCSNKPKIGQFCARHAPK